MKFLEDVFSVLATSQTKRQTNRQTNAPKTYMEMDLALANGTSLFVLSENF